MILGFTGTRKGLTAEQRSTLEERLRGWGSWIVEWHDGAAVGADSQARMLFHRLRPDCFPKARIHSHPAATGVEITGEGTFEQGRLALPADVVHPSKLPLVRNRDIVRASQRLIACPGGLQEELRSGTWMTVRYARKLGKTIVYIWPTGAQTMETPKV